MECSGSKPQVIVESPPAPDNGREQNNQERDNKGTSPPVTDTPPQSDSHSIAVSQSDSHSIAVSQSDSHSIAVSQSDSHSITSDPNPLQTTSASSTTTTTCTDTQLSTVANSQCSPIMKCTISVSANDAYNILKSSGKMFTSAISPTPATPTITMATTPTDITPPLISASIQVKLNSCMDSNKPKKRGRKRKKATPLSNISSSQSDTPTNETTPGKPITRRRTRGAGLRASPRVRKRTMEEDTPQGDTSTNIRDTSVDNESTVNDRNQPLSKKSRIDPATPITDPATPITDPATPITGPATPITEPATPITEPATPITDPVMPVTDTPTPTHDHAHSSVATPTSQPLPAAIVQQALQALYIEIAKKVATSSQLPSKPHPLLPPNSGGSMTPSFMSTLLASQKQLNAYLKVQTINLQQMSHTSSPVGMVIPSSLSATIQKLFSYFNPPSSPPSFTAGPNDISKSFYENIRLLKKFLEDKLPLSVSIDVPSFSSSWQPSVPVSSKTTANINTNPDIEDPLPAKKRKESDNEGNKDPHDNAAVNASVDNSGPIPVVIQQNVAMYPANIASNDDDMDCDNNDSDTTVDTSGKVGVADIEGVVSGCGTTTVAINEKAIEPNQSPSLVHVPTLAALALAVIEGNKTDTGATPSVLLPPIQRIRSAHMVEEGSLPNTPSQDSTSSSPRTTPIGILKKNIGQLDTPLSTGKVHVHVHTCHDRYTIIHYYHMYRVYLFYHTTFIILFY